MQGQKQTLSLSSGHAGAAAGGILPPTSTDSGNWEDSCSRHILLQVKTAVYEASKPRSRSAKAREVY